MGTRVTWFSVMLCRPDSILCAARWPACLRLTTLSSITIYTHWPMDLPLRTGTIRVLDRAAVQRAMYFRSINSTREMDVRPASIGTEFRRTGSNGRASHFQSYALRHAHEVSSLSGWARHDVTVTELSFHRVEGKRKPQSDRFPLIRWCRKITIMVLAVIDESRRF